MEILVTGATGFIGTEVARQLAIRGWRPRLVVRRPPARRLAETEALNVAAGWRSRPALQTPDTVVSWNLDPARRPGALWSELGLEPELPTYREGIAATLDEQVAVRWRHPVADARR